LRPARWSLSPFKAERYDRTLLDGVPSPQNSSQIRPISSELSRTKSVMLLIFPERFSARMAFQTCARRVGFGALFGKLSSQRSTAAFQTASGMPSDTTIGFSSSLVSDIGAAADAVTEIEVGACT
jgi:hypothetical protein